MDPLERFHQIEPFNRDLIKSIYPGEKYTAVELINGNIGVCANLRNETKDVLPLNIDFNNIQHRIIIQAYYNAFFCQAFKSEFIQDKLIDLIEEKKYNLIVMIGLFKPIYQEFLHKNIFVHVFDFFSDEPFILDYKNRFKYIPKADCIIISATTIFNQTFTELTELSGKECDIHILGPSTPMTQEMFNYKNIKYLHGILPTDSKKIIEVIVNNQGTRKFIRHCDKVMLKSSRN